MRSWEVLRCGTYRDLTARCTGRAGLGLQQLGSQDRRAAISCGIAWRAGKLEYVRGFHMDQLTFK